MSPTFQSFSAPNVSRGLAILLVAVVGTVYANSFGGPFLFDDALSIVENPTIRQLWPMTQVLSPPSGQGITVEGRPLVNLSFAFNYAISGNAPWSYHAVNVAIHALAALMLFGLVRRTLESLRTPSAPMVAFSVALLWAVHPLQTESVTYLAQRTESLMGLWLLATLYFFQRREFFWSFLACTLGMATKEVMVVAPLLVVLYDRTFVAGSFRAGWDRHGKFYVALASTWLLLAFLVLGAGNRGGTIGSAAGVTPWDYALCQSRAVLHYARLALWPSPLIFDYGQDFISLATAAPYLVVDLLLLAVTGYALWRRPALGFLGAWYFLILAPTSSFVGGTRQMLAEHRIYLSLAALTILAVLAAQRTLGRRWWLVPLCAATALGAATIQRNTVYSSAISLYRDTAAQRPTNGFARYNLGQAYAEAGRHVEAIAEFEAAARLLPAASAMPFNLGNSFVALARPVEAQAAFTTALRLNPRYPKAHFNLGNLLLERRDLAGALEHFRAVVALDPSDLAARNNLGGVLLELGEPAAAIEHLVFAARAQPDTFEAHFGLGNAYLLLGRQDEAAREFEAVLRLRPDLALARERLQLAQSRR